MKKHPKQLKQIPYDAKSVENNLEYDYVKLLACRLNAITIYGAERAISTLGYSLANSRKAITALSKLGIVNKRWVDEGYSYDKFYIEPQYVIYELKQMSWPVVYENFVKVQNADSFRESVKDDRTKALAKFMKAVWLYLHDEEDACADCLKDCSTLIKNLAYEEDSQAYRIMVYILGGKEYHGFFSLMPEPVKRCWRDAIVSLMADLKKPLEHEAYRHMFFDDGGVRYDDFSAILYVVCGELFVNGHIDNLIAKYDVPVKGRAIGNKRLVRYLDAIKSLHASDPKPMIEVTVDFSEMVTSNWVAIPPFGWYAMSAVVMSKEPQSLKSVNSLLRKLDKDEAAMTRAVSDWMQKSKLGPKALERLDDSPYRPSAKLLFSYFVNYFAMDEIMPVLARMKSGMMAEVMNGGYNYLKLVFSLFAGDSRTVSQKYEDLCGMSPLFADMARKPEWEKVLDRLVLQLGSSKKSNATVKSAARVAYLINMNDSSVRPILQKSASGASWTKGRNVALKTFADGKTEAMTPQDMKVASLIEMSEDWYSGYLSVDYYIPPRKGIAALAGHPYVFTDDNRRLKIEITEIPLQLSVHRERNGSFKLATNVKINELKSDGIYIDASNPLNIQVCRLNQTQMSIVRTLSEIRMLPSAAEKKLSETLGALSAQMTVMSDLVTSGEGQPERVDASPVIVAQLVPEDEMINVSLYAKPLATTAPYLTPGMGAEFVNGVVDGKSVQARRDLSLEKANLAKVEDMLRNEDDYKIDSRAWRLDLERTLSLLADIAAAPQTACVEWPEGVRFKLSRPTLFPSDLGVKVKSSNNWFELEGELKIGDDVMLSVAELLQKIREGKGRFIRLQGDEYIALSQHLADTLRSIARIADVKTKKAGMSAFHADFVHDLEQAGAQVSADRATTKFLERVSEASHAVIKVPKGIQADLRDYQKDGFRWMSRLALWRAGACLADDMGLGKTLQTICLLLANRKDGPSLVVAPTSLLLNWRDEIARFAPSLTVRSLNNTNDSAVRHRIVNDAAPSDVIIASYGLLVTEQEALASREWNIIVLDEAHTIKNRDTKMSQSAMTLKGKMRVALTGTPLQNRLSEIWNIFQFLDPGLLGSFQSFSERFIVPIEKEGDRSRQKLLKKMVAPFLLRRTKNDVLSELPPKTEIVIPVELSEHERALYETLRREAEVTVAEAGSQSAILALAEITRLRKAACNPRLIDSTLHVESSKMSVFMQLVANLRGNHHRALVFSQFTSHLALVREKLDAEGVDYLYLDGSTPALERAKLVEQFQKGDMPLFLISLKAGGLGLNLTAADYVIHLDPWWNPAIEDQASDRSYRIGQTKPVTVYRLIAADTIEDKILKLHARKKSLADALLEGTDMSARMTREEILALLASVQE